MSTATIINDTMTLDEKLAAIDAAMANAQADAQSKTNDTNVDVPFDPADLTMCIGCQ